MKQITLVGNPNVGKTTLFNSLTKSFEHTGNWHGVTVDKKEKEVIYENDNYKIIDLPGLYSMTSFSFEEQVSIDFLLSNKTEIINICDANVLERNLYLTLQLLEAGLSPTILINFDREIKKKGRKYDYNKLSKILGVKIVKNDDFIKENFFSHNSTFKNKFAPLYLQSIPIKEILKILLPSQLKQFSCNKEFIAIKILENDEKIIEKLNLTIEQEKQIKNIAQQDDYITLIAKYRYNYIESILNQCLIKQNEFVYGKFKFDKIILNKFLCLPIFLCILFTIFYLTFSSLGEILSEWLKLAIDELIGVPITNLLIKINAPLWTIDLFSNGIIGGVGGLLCFVPQIVLLFLSLSLLEDSGYMSRLAFSFEDVFYKFGLSGKSIFTILMSFGCTTTAVLTSRNIEDKNTKIKTAMISPYMSCSAKLPIYAVIGGAFFSKGNIFIIIALYIIGVLVGLLVSNLLGKKYLVSGKRSFILEFPPYRLPSLKQISITIWQNIKLFFVKVSTILLSFSVIVWILQNFSFKFEYIPTVRSATSMLETIGKALSIVFRPIGLDNWGIVVSLLVGIMAKEMVVSTMAIVNNIPSSINFEKQLGVSFLTSSFVINFSPLTAIIMMIFSLLYMPCISTIAVLKKEIGWKLTIVACLVQFVVAYSICFVIYQFGVGTTLSKIFISILVVCLLIFIFTKSFILAKKKGMCLNCLKNCKKCINKNID